MADAFASLSALAEDLGVHLAYHDLEGKERRASEDSLLTIVRALGENIESGADAEARLHERRLAAARRTVEPVIVVTQGEDLVFELRVAEHARGPLECFLKPDVRGLDSTASAASMRVNIDELPEIRRTTDGGTIWVALRITWSLPLDVGYHVLTLKGPFAETETWVICAPRRVPTLETGKRIWGVFSPTYAIRSQHDWGIGSYSELSTLADWAGGLGASFVGTLPLLAAFLREPFEASPYAAASRLFYNEALIHIDDIPDLTACEAARRERSSPDLGERLIALRGSDLVDYREVMSLKRRVLESLSRHLAEFSPERFDAFQRYRNEHPRLTDYARFRAVGDRLNAAWQLWPDALRGGDIGGEDFDPEVARYHEYAQWIAAEQATRVARTGAQHGTRLYLDLPLGVQASSYDVYRERSTFVLGASAGAPPDALFRGGQVWGNPPLHPERIREQRYDYFIESLRHHLVHAGILRLDHVMGLHRIFFVPVGASAANGVYVSYRAEELYAVLSVEAHRAGTLIVGEDLGTVPDQVRSAMAEHGLYRMHVTQFELTDDPEAPLRPPAPNTLASLNTHDTMPFGGFIAELDIDEHVRLALATEENTGGEREARRRVVDRIEKYLRKDGWMKDEAGSESLSEAIHLWLAASDAQLVSINLEDLWMEEAPQNVPGTSTERPNWRRKHRISLEALMNREDFRRVLERVEQLRR